MTWRLEATDPAPHGQRQTGFQVRVAGDPARLATSGEIWDSGELEAAATEAVYAGRPLRMNQACHWSVRVRDEAGGWSEWSAPAGWVMGPLDTRDSGIGMHGDWIDWVNAGFKK